jgi:hypothetical protein
MPPAAGSGSGKETVALLSDLAVRLDQLEEIMCALTTKVGDIDQQQHAFNIVLVRLEQGRTAPDANNQTPAALEAANGDAAGGQTSDDHRSRHHLSWNLGRHHLHLTAAISLRRMIRMTTTSFQLTTNSTFLSLTGPAIRSHG